MRTLPPIVYMSNGVAPKSATPEEKGSGIPPPTPRREIEDCRHHGVLWDLSEVHRHHGVFGEANIVHQNY
jgi:hypothetical protein